MEDFYQTSLYILFRNWSSECLKFIFPIKRCIIHQINCYNMRSPYHSFLLVDCTFMKSLNHFFLFSLDKRKTVVNNMQTWGKLVHISFSEIVQIMVTGYESDQLYTDTIYFKFLQVNSLASKGGHSIIDGVRRMLPEMLTNLFMKEMNWTG